MMVKERGSRPIYRPRKGKIMVRGSLGDRFGWGKETDGGTRVPRRPAVVEAAMRRGGHAESQRRRWGGVGVLKADMWRRWRCQTGAGAASRGEEMAAAATVCRNGGLEVEDVFGGLVCNNKKVQGAVYKLKFVVDLGLK